jgi:hypothetical protein
VHNATGHAVAFTGPTHAGKSTTAYALAQHPGWTLLADDTVAFSIANEAATIGGGHVQLSPIAQEIRLRPEAAAHFGVERDAGASRVEWSDRTRTLRAIYVLEGDESATPAAEFNPLSASGAIPLLLQQAFALSFGMPQYNQALMKAYAALAASVPAFRLRYRRSFDSIDALVAAIDCHARQPALGVDSQSARR